MKIKKLLYSFVIIFFIAQASFLKDIEQIKAETSVENEDLPIKIRKYLLSQHVNGSVAIIKGRNVLFNEGLGFASVTPQALNQAETTFPIASITKLIVATCIMQLQEKGKLTIYDPVSKYIPTFPNGKEIRLIHLLNHTSGIQTPPWHIEDKKPIEIIKRIQLKPIQFPPGTRWDYNDINYTVLGYIVETVSGTSLHGYIQRNIFEKAMMKHSGFITQRKPKAYTTVGYKRAAKQMTETKPLKMNRLFGCADIYSTALDICLFDQALMSGKLVKRNTLQSMLIPGSDSGYGLGLYSKDHKVYSRGVIDGWESFHEYYFDGTVITILLNVRDDNLHIHQISRNLYHLIHANS